MLTGRPMYALDGRGRMVVGRGDVMRKIVKTKTRKLFMRTLLEVAARNKSDLVEPHAPELHVLRQREDYDRVIAVLEGLGLIATVNDINHRSKRYKILPEGLCFFERLRDDLRSLLVRSILIPVLVSLITAALTVYVLPSLGKQAEKWLSDMSQHTQPPTEEPAPSDAPADIQRLYQPYPQEAEEIG